MQRLTDLATSRRRLVAISWLILAIAGGWAASGISDALSQSFDAPGREAFQANREIAQRFGNGGTIAPIVLVATVPEGRKVTDAAVRADLARAVERVTAAVGRARSVSYASTGDRAFVSADGRTTYAYVFPPLGRPAPDENPQALAAARRAAAATEVGGKPLAVTGVEALADDSDSGGGAGLLVETVAGGLGALLVLAWVFGSWLALVPLLVAVVSILTTFLALRGLAALTDVSFVVQFLVALIGLGVAIDYSLLIVIRWREERARHDDNLAAIRTAMRTAGHSVAVSGLTVAIGLLALVVVPVPFIRSIGFGGLLIPLISVAAALTLVPAVLAAIGPRIDRRHRPERDAQPGARWTAWARLVVRRRWPAALAGLAILVLLAAVATTLRPGRPAVDALSSGGTAQQALRTLERAGLGAGALTPVELVSEDGARLTATQRDALARDVDGVRGVVSPDDWRRGDVAVSVALLGPDAATDAGQDAVDALRASDVAKAGGPSAQDRDLTDAIYAAFPLMVAIIALITFLLLARALRSVLLPIKAIVLNVLSVASAFGIVVLVWQEGHGSQLIGGVPATDTITNWVPLAIFAFLYGLSMDYEVFILSRMREEYERSGSTDEAVVAGLGRTGRMVTSAALILFLAFVALGAAPNTEIRILATGLAAGILLDATVVRALVVPALVTLFGRANWWLPEWAATAGRRRRV
ncbi:MMPL family transporter [Baekduia sp. Peel2402]|uniref:MMPL family transporter n=1 Tax=Baekduia sp. Peel2402 TaxID=3458296 RepID=UPI00403E49B8